MRACKWSRGRRPQVLGLNAGAIAVGRQADLVVLDTRQAADAVLCPPPRLATFKAGRLIVQTEIERAVA